MMRPKLTDTDRKKFETEFNQIIAKAPIEIQKVWNGKIMWVADIPHFLNNIPSKLKGKLATEYNALSNRLKGRKL